MLAPLVSWSWSQRWETLISKWSQARQSKWPCLWRPQYCRAWLHNLKSSKCVYDPGQNWVVGGTPGTPWPGKGPALPTRWCRAHLSSAGIRFWQCFENATKPICTSPNPTEKGRINKNLKLKKSLLPFGKCHAVLLKTLVAAKGVIVKPHTHLRPVLQAF